MLDANAVELACTTGLETATALSLPQLWRREPGSKRLPSAVTFFPPSGGLLQAGPPSLRSACSTLSRLASLVSAEAVRGVWPGAQDRAVVVLASESDEQGRYPADADRASSHALSPPVVPTRHSIRSKNSFYLSRLSESNR
jgi:hypothetical protein